MIPIANLPVQYIKPRTTPRRVEPVSPTAGTPNSTTRPNSKQFWHDELAMKDDEELKM